MFAADRVQDLLRRLREDVAALIQSEIDLAKTEVIEKVKTHAKAAVLVAIALCGAARCTVGRWTAWWTEALPQSTFWRVARARLMPPVDEARLPAELLIRFPGDREDALFKALVFIAPITAAPRSSSSPMGP